MQDGAATYTPGISEKRGTTSKFYHGDTIGSTGALTNSSQSSTDTLTYDAWGNATQTGSSVVPFGYGGGQGYQSDTDSGLKLLGNRYYDSDSGRFLSQDPAQDGNNWYAYAGNNPLRHTDPLGLATPPPPTGGSSAGVEAPKTGSQPDPAPKPTGAGKGSATPSNPPYAAPSGYEWIQTRFGTWQLRNCVTGSVYTPGQQPGGSASPQPVGGTGKNPAPSIPGDIPGTPTNPINLPGGNSTVSRGKNGLPDGGRIKIKWGPIIIIIQGNPGGFGGAVGGDF